MSGYGNSLNILKLIMHNPLNIHYPGLLLFFNNCADDLFLAVNELKEGGQYALLRGENLK